MSGKIQQLEHVFDIRSGLPKNDSKSRTLQKE